MSKHAASSSNLFHVIWQDSLLNMSLNVERKRILVKMRYLELGLIPPDDNDVSFGAGQHKNSIDNALSMLSPEERRATTRKFRKQTRKLGASSNSSKARKRAKVYSDLWREVSLEVDVDYDLDDIFD
jgi:hypothetical protein